MISEEKQNALPIEKLKDILDYSPDTGLFIWKKWRSRLAKKGGVAGKVDRINGGYLVIGICKRIYKAHRLAWFYAYGEWPNGYIDHINHDKLDNRICNLREASAKQNQQNLPVRSNNSSGATGVSFLKHMNKWRAYIHFEGKQILLGRFENIEDAIFARKKANKKYGYHENHGN